MMKKTKGKGVNRNVVCNIRHKEYGDVLFGEKIIKHYMKRIQSEFHTILTTLPKFLYHVLMVNVIFLMME